VPAGEQLDWDFPLFTGFVIENASETNLFPAIEDYICCPQEHLQSCARHESCTARPFLPTRLFVTLHVVSKVFYVLLSGEVVEVAAEAAIVRGRKLDPVHRDEDLVPVHRARSELQTYLFLFAIENFSMDGVGMTSKKRLTMSGR